MGFLGIGTWEILLIIIIALIILGPGKLTDFARSMGKTVRAIRKASSDLTTAVTRELDEAKKESPPSPPLEERTHEAPPPVSKPEAEARTNSPPNEERQHR